MAFRRRCVGDVTRLRQVLVNLVSNGIKFTSAGEVVVQVKVLSAPEPGASGTEPWHLHFQVRDTGIGIPVDRLARLFKSFSQADASTTRQYGGTGLGLAISKRLVELMGGKMWVESVPQKGSTFQFTLPLQAAPDAPPQPLEGAQPQLADLRLLIVDDNPTNCRILTLQTRKWGMIPRDTRKRRAGPGMAARGRELRPGHPGHANARHGRLDAGRRNPQAAGCADYAAGAADLDGRAYRPSRICPRRALPAA